jgi:hypothetical protein
VLTLIGSGSTIFLISGSQGSILQVNDNPSSSELFAVTSASVDILKVSTTNVSISSSLNVSNGIIGSLQGTSSWANNSISSSYASTAQTLLGSVISASYAETASFSPNYTLLSTFNPFSQSIHNFTASVVRDSASFDSRINLKTDLTEFRPYSQSINVFTASVIRDSASFDSRINGMSGATPGGSYKQIQFNSASVFSGSTNLYQESNQILITGSYSGSALLVVKAAGNQAENIFDVQNSAGSTYFNISSAGNNYLGFRPYVSEYLGFGGDNTIGQLMANGYTMLGANGNYGVTHRTNSGAYTFFEYFGGATTDGAYRYMLGKSFFGGPNTPLTASIEIISGSSTLGQLKFHSGSLMSQISDGVMGYDGTHLYFDIGSNKGEYAYYAE